MQQMDPLVQPPLTTSNPNDSVSRANLRSHQRAS